MNHPLRETAAALSVCVALAIAAAPSVAAAAPGTPAVAPAGSGLPQLPAARQAAGWLAAQFNEQGFIPAGHGSTTPNLSATAQSVLALSAANVDSALATQGLAYLAAHVDAYVTDGGADGPGQLAVLILDAVALGTNPASFGGSDLVTRLLATEQPSGTDDGLFGTQTQVETYAAGNYAQGLALSALAAAGMHGTARVTAAANWLAAEQCPDGGWTTPDNSVSTCTGSPATYAGPTMTSTALAIEGLAAQGALTPAISSAARSFIAGAQDADGGWSYYPSTEATPATSDPDSTALVVQALLALGVTPTGGSLTKGTATPVSALLSFQITAGPAAGALYYPPTTTSPNLIATYQAVPALAGLAVPFGTSGGAYWLAAADGSVTPFGNAANLGSLPALGVSVHDVTAIAPTADGGGYWLTGADGGVFAFGDAAYHGSLPALGIDVDDVVATVVTPAGDGYWLIGADGGVFGFGDAAYYGSLPGLGVHVGDVVGAVPTPDGKGYWLVGADGGVFAFGDAGFVGSLPSLGVEVSDVVGIAPTADGKGYWLVGADGGVFALGDAGFVGSLPSLGVEVSDVVGVAATADAGGYYLVASTGGVYAFGDAHFSGSAVAAGVTDVVAIAVSPARPV